ncbi:MAG TPA: hypothetical protein VL172_05960, partial [Kofleriaceae bacterium]|nr:hypothetical protein [Kofleriaceae bacterium]
MRAAHTLMTVVSLALLSGAGVARADQPTWATKIGPASGSESAVGAFTSGTDIYTAGNAGGGGWVARHNKDGVQQWRTSLAGSGPVSAIGFINQFGPVVVGYDSTSGVARGWVRHLDMMGRELWKKDIGLAQVYPTAAAAGESAWYTYVVGYGLGLVGDAQLGGGDGWIAKYDGSGNLIWARQIGGSENDRALAVAYDDATGALYVAGSTKGLDTVLIGGSWVWPLAAWVMKFDKNGNFQWKQTVDTPGQEEVTAVAATSSGVYVAGWTNTAIERTNQGNNDVWAAYYTATGARQWLHQYGTAYSETVTDATVDASRNVYLG